MTSGSEKRARSSHLTVRLRRRSGAALDAKADRAGLTPGSYARNTVLGEPAPRQVRRPPVERRELARILGELGKIGSNLNQLARAANSGTVLDTTEIAAALAGLPELRTTILKALGRLP